MDVKTMSLTSNLSGGELSQAPAWIYHFQGTSKKEKKKKRFWSQTKKMGMLGEKSYRK